MSDFRLKVGFSRHYKTKRLERLGGRDACWSLLCLIEFAAGHRPTGELDGMSAEDLAVAAQWPGDAETLASWLREAGFLDGEPGAYRIHDFAEHQPYVSTGPQRSRSARAAALIRWHREGRHAEAVDGCPICDASQAAPVHTDAVRTGSHPDTKLARNHYGSDTNSIRTDTNSIRTRYEPIRTDTNLCKQPVTAERSRARRGNVLVRWHKAGKHVEPVAECPDCYPKCEPMRTDANDTNDTNSIRTDTNSDTNSIRTDTNRYEKYEPHSASDTNKPLPMRLSEIDALHDAPRMRSHANRYAPDPDPDLRRSDLMSEVAQIGVGQKTEPSCPPQSSDPQTSSPVPDDASAAKLNDLAVHEWGWYPLTQPQTLRAIQLAPFSAAELAAAREVVEQRDAGRKTRGKLGLLLAVVESRRNGGASPSSKPKPQAHGWRDRLSDKDEAWLREHVAWCRMHERTGDAPLATEELERVRDEWLTRRGQARADEILQ